MHQEFSQPVERKLFAGWMGVLLIVVGYIVLYLLNLWLPLGRTGYTTRIWDWSQTALTLAAFVVLISHQSRLKSAPVLLGFVLALVSALSHSLHDPDVWGCLKEGLAVWVCFLGGVVLFKDLKVWVIPAFQPPLANIGRSLLIGIAFAIPLAVLNNIYFYITTGEIQFMGVFVSGFEALSPAIHEEIIFRFFVMAICLSLLRNSISSRWSIIVAIFLAVVPHSLNHLPDLFLRDPKMGFMLLIATSLLFGLPMALLQIKRNLETAISFHWFIDFMRFLFGF